MYMLGTSLLRNNPCSKQSAVFGVLRHFSSEPTQHGTSASKEEFRVLDLKKKKGQRIERRKGTKPLIMPPRSERMPVDQDWVSVWPGPRSFHPATVPLPIRQGIPPTSNTKVGPGKFANAELMKIPNFLHLTPPAIKRHCEALQKFCSKWPAGLETDADCERHFPIEVVKTTYCHSSPSIRDPLARIITLRVKLSSLQLDAHARDKFLRLVGDRYDEKTDTVSILTDRCPTSRQNEDYAHFLLAALYHESWKVEEWEKEKGLVDMEYFDWKKSVSYETVKQIAARKPDLKEDVAEMYGEAVKELIDKGEDAHSVEKYKELSKKLLSLSDTSDEPLNQAALQ